MKIATNVYAVMGLAQRHPAGVNAGFIVTNQHIVYIDSGWTIASAQTIYGYSKAAAPLSSPHALIFTDKHLDHISGMKVLREAGAQLVGHAKLDALLREDLVNNYQQLAPQICPEDVETSRITFRDVYLYPLDKVISAEEVLRVDDQEMLLIPTPGHNNACLSVYLPESKILFAGDTVFSEYQPVTKYGDRDLWTQWIKSLERLEQLEIEKIIPGHGRICSKAEIRRNIDYLKKLLDETVAAKE